MSHVSLLGLSPGSLVTFDFDDTLLWTRKVLDTDGSFLDTEDVGLNPFAVPLLRECRLLGLRARVVTSRHTESMSGPVEQWKALWGLQSLLGPTVFTDGDLKACALRQLGSVCHFDDDLEELIHLPVGCGGVFSNIHPSWSDF